MIAENSQRGCVARAGPVLSLRGAGLTSVHSTRIPARSDTVCVTFFIKLCRL